MVQAPALHTIPVLQLVAQSPQCAELDCVSTHTPPQFVYPELHAMPQPVAPQVGAPLATMAQTVLHLPQCNGSVSSFTQLEPQAE